MAENGTRKGERSKKPPKYLQYDVSNPSVRKLIMVFTLQLDLLSKRYHVHYKGKAS